jgi:hypothetical protein
MFSVLDLLILFLWGWRFYVWVGFLLRKNSFIWIWILKFQKSTSKADHSQGMYFVVLHLEVFWSLVLMAWEGMCSLFLQCLSTWVQDRTWRVLAPNTEWLLLAPEQSLQQIPRAGKGGKPLMRICSISGCKGQAVDLPQKDYIVILWSQYVVTCGQRYLTDVRMLKYITWCNTYQRRAFL